MYFGSGKVGVQHFLLMCTCALQVWILHTVAIKLRALPKAVKPSGGRFLALALVSLPTNYQQGTLADQTHVHGTEMVLWQDNACY